MNELDPYDQMLKIPHEVILAAKKVADWVGSNMAGHHDIRIYGVGVRLFLSVQDMLREAAPEIRISELKP